MKLAKRFVVSKKTIITATVIITVVIAGATIGVLTIKNKATENGTKNTQAVDAPNYKTVLPTGASISSLGGWSRISPPENDPVYAYTDAINGVSINVSEQPLPASFKGDVDAEVLELAKKYSATTQVNAGSVKVYIGTSAKGPQSVIFTKNNLLVLIKSQQKIDDKNWEKYVESLS
ncbi:MAG: hypothetical protein JWO54_242 [Candidatus Saccharibacteria bacterium]|nr:hypothetical protein [Candidatus Saccharibacteria bacterium]MDB5180484.1 hypothetical protein [Candidatus Saccharibacteria bacterium]